MNDTNNEPKIEKDNIAVNAQTIPSNTNQQQLNNTAINQISQVNTTSQMPTNDINQINHNNSVNINSQAQNSNINPINQSNINVSKDKAKTDEIKTDEIKTDEIKTDEVKTKFPFAVVLVALGFVAGLLLYYYAWLTPTRVFDEAVDDTFGDLESMLMKTTTPKIDTSKIVIDTILKTSGKNTKNYKDLKFIDGLKVLSNTNLDLKNLDFEFSLFSDSKATHDMKYNKDFNAALDYIDESFYLKINDKPIKYESTSGYEKYAAVNYDRIKAIVAVSEELRNRAVDIVQPEQLKKTITTKKINNQTALAIKVSVSLDNDAMTEMRKAGYDCLHNNKEFIKNFSKMAAISEEEGKSEIERLFTRDIISNNVTIDLYMNLANTDIIAIDVKVDDYYVEIKSLNGFYFIDFQYSENGFKVLDTSIEYDKHKGYLNGICSIENIATKLIFEFNYKSIKSENSNSIIGNTLDFKFYDDNSGIPFATLDCNLDIENNIKINLDADSKVQSILTLEKDDLEYLKYTIDKFLHETMFVAKKLFFNKLEDLNPKEVDKTMNKYKEILNEKIGREILNLTKININKMPKEQLKVILNSPNMQKELMDKLDLFLSPGCKKDLIIYLGQLKNNL